MKNKIVECDTHIAPKNKAAGQGLTPAIKKIVSLFLAITMLFSITAGIDLSANATTNHTQQEAVNWINSQVGKSLDYDGAYGAQCVDLIYYYYQYLGVAVQGGNGSDYAWNTLPSGWKRINYSNGFTPQGGDIGVWSGVNHVGIWASSSVFVDQNSNGRSYVASNSNLASIGLSLSSMTCVIRPDFKAPVSITFNNLSATNIGNYSATLNFKVLNPNNSIVDKVGVRIKKEGFSWETHEETLSSDIYKSSVLTRSYDVGFGKEFDYTLSSDTSFTWQAYAIVNGTAFYSSSNTFTTTKVTPAVITFDGNGGTPSKYKESFTKGMNYGEKMPIASRNGYSFLGWYTEPNGGSFVDTDERVTSDKTLYAHWEKNYENALENGGIYHIYNQGSGLPLEADDSDSNLVHQEIYNDNDAQLWQVYIVDGGYVFNNLKYNKRLGIINDDDIYKRFKTVSLVSASNDLSVFTLSTPKYVDDRVVYKIYNTGTGRVLHIAHTTSPSYSLYQYVSYETDYQQFYFEKATLNTPEPKAIINSNGSSTISWNKVANADKYEVYCCDNNDGVYKLYKTTTETSITTDIGTPGVTYYKVKAIDSNNYYNSSDFSESVQVLNKEHIHTWDNGKVTKKASCTATGIRTYTCTDCGETKTETIKATGHTAVTDKAVSATCTTAGKTAGSHCSVCNAVITAQKTVPATGHSYDSGKITKAASCTANGTKTYTCTVCKIAKTETINATGHKSITDAAVKPTCTTSGLTQGSHCAVCGAVLVEQKELLAEHKWNEGIVTKRATCISNGKKSITCLSCGETKEQIILANGHNYTESVVKPTCTNKGYIEYNCSACGDSFHDNFVNAKGHTYKTITSKATTSKNGSIVTKCSVCGTKKSSTTIYYPKTITLSTTSYTYNGKVKKPSVSVKDSKGNKIASSNYTVSYPSGRKNVGKYTVTIKFKGNYSGTVKKTFTIKPKATTVSKVTAGKKKFTVKWKKLTTQTTGYQIQYSTSSKFSSAKTVTVSKNKTTSKSVSKLKAKKKYYVRVRTYKTVKVNGKSTKIYSSWSKSKSVTTKK